MWSGNFWILDLKTCLDVQQKKSAVFENNEKILWKIIFEIHIGQALQILQPNYKREQNMGGVCCVCTHTQVPRKIGWVIGGGAHPLSILQHPKIDIMCP